MSLLLTQIGRSRHQKSALNLADGWEYFDIEQEIARDPRDPRHLLPAFPRGARVLDIGCGGGLDHAVFDLDSYVGVDIDDAAVEYCKKHDPNGCYYQGQGENLWMIRDQSASFLMSRVAIPYMDIQRFIAEARRVLEPAGTIWLSYHDVGHVLRHLGRSIRNLNGRNILFRSYVLLNGMLFHLLGCQFSFPFLNKIESFQTRRGLRRALEQAGFTSIEFWSDPSRGHYTVTAKKSIHSRALSL